MASRSQILVDNNTSFPDNTTSLITPQILRDYNSELANSVVFNDQTGSMSVASASFATTASFALNGGGGGTIDTGSFATTGSNTFTGPQTYNSQTIFNGTPVMNAPLLMGNSINFTGSVFAPATANFADMGMLDANRFGFNSKDKNATTSGSEFTIIVNSGSLFTEIGFDAYYGGTIGEMILRNNNGNRLFEVRADQTNLYSPVNIVGGLSASNASFSSITGSLLGTASFATTASFALNAGTTIDTSSFVLNSQTSSMSVGFATNASTAFAATSASFATTASFALNAGTTVDTGSFVTTSSFNAFTSSQSILNGTFATTGSNTFTGNQTFNANTTFNASQTVTGSIFLNGNIEGPLAGASFGTQVLIQTSSAVTFVMDSPTQSLSFKNHPALNELMVVNNEANEKIIGFDYDRWTTIIKYGLETGIDFRGIDTLSGKLNITSSTPLLDSTGSFVNIAGTATFTGSLLTKPQSFQTTERPISILEAGDGTSTGGNLISTRSTNALATGSVHVTGSNNFIALSAGISNTFVTNGRGSIIRGTNSIILGAVPGITGSNGSGYNRPAPSFTNSINAGSITVTDNRPTTTTAPLTFTSNNNNGSITATLTTASVSLSSNMMLGNSVINVTGSAGAARSISNSILGSFLGNRIEFDGSGGNVIASMLLGNSLTASFTDTNVALNSVSVLGYQLAVSGSGPLGGTTLYGSTYVGRWNAQDDTSKPGTTVFAVGAGTSNAARRTSLHVSSSGLTSVRDGLNVTGSLNTTGSITIQSGSGDLFVYGNKQFNGAQYSSLATQTGSAAVSQSITFDTTGPEFGVSLVDNTKLTVTNSGTYNIQFSAQLLADTGADSVYIWFKKNGTNIAGSASELAIANNDEALMTVNILDTAVANDYYEICWQSTNGDAVLLFTGASGNVPSIPSVIATITQVR